MDNNKLPRIEPYKNSVRFQAKVLENRVHMYDKGHKRLERIYGSMLLQIAENRTLWLNVGLPKWKYDNTEDSRYAKLIPVTNMKDKRKHGDNADTVLVTTGFLERYINHIKEDKFDKDSKTVELIITNKVCSNFISTTTKTNCFTIAEVEIYVLSVLDNRVTGYTVKYGNKLEQLTFMAKDKSTINKMKDNIGKVVLIDYNPCKECGIRLDGQYKTITSIAETKFEITKIRESLRDAKEVEELLSHEDMKIASEDIEMYEDLTLVDDGEEIPF